MKNHIRIHEAFLLLLCANLSAYAQVDSIKRTKYEIGLGIPIIAFNKFQNIPAQNLSFKIVKNKNVFRSGISGNLAYTRFIENKNYGF